MSVELSERNFKVENSKVIAMQSAERIAKASAMSGELTEVWIADPWEGAFSSGPVKLHLSPTVFVDAFQAPSVLKTTDSSSTVLLEDCLQ